MSCFARSTADTDELAQVVAGMGADWWEAPAGQASRVVFGFEMMDGDEPITALLATTSSGMCTSPPTKLDTVPGKAETSHAFVHPRLSPSGHRVAYLRTTGEGSMLATVGFDGTNPHVVGAWHANPDGSPNPSKKAVLPDSLPVWLNDTTVAWLQPLEDGKWRIVSAPDKTDAEVTTVMSYTGTRPHQFDVLPSGEILVTQSFGDHQATELLVYPITAGTKECGTPPNLTKFEPPPAGISAASEFALPPDKTRVAYRSFDAATDIYDIRIVPVDGSSPPVPVAPGLENATRGPRWVAGDAFITWGNAAEALDAGTGSVVAVIPANGGAPRTVASGPEGTGTHAIGPGRCSFGPVFGSGATLFGIAALAGLGIARRRQRG